jgi:cytidine deaminase
LFLRLGWEATSPPVVQQARQAALNAYAPYSGLRAGAALRLTNGKTVTGANVENLSCSLNLCAERSALVRTVSQFGPRFASRPSLSLI